MRIAICDDEAIQRELIVRSTKKYFAAKNIPASIQEYENAEQLFMQRDAGGNLDLVLLDIQMEGMDGVALAEKLRSQNEALSIIFITGLTNYIYEGFRLSAINYLLKPLEEEKLHACLTKAIEQWEKQEDILVLKVEKELVKLKKGQILRVESAGHYLTIVAGEQSCCIKMSMKEMEQELSKEPFYKISRSDLVNLNAIERITSKEITMINHDKILIPKGKHQQISEAFLNCHFRKENNLC